MKITLKQLRVFNQSTAAQKLFHTPMTGKLAYDVKKMLDALSKAGTDHAQPAYKAFLARAEEAHGKKDEQGAVIKAEGGYGFEFASEEAEQAFHDEKKVFEETLIEVANRQIQTQRLLSCDELKLTVAELMVLEPFLSELVLIEGEGRGSLPEGTTPSPAVA